MTNAESRHLIPQPQLGITPGASASGKQSRIWTVLGKKISSRCHKNVSPEFTLDLGKQVKFQMTLWAKKVNDMQGGVAFAASGGKGSVEIRCLEEQVDASISLRIQFAIVVGNCTGFEKKSQPVIHDFSRKFRAGLPADDADWDFSEYLDNCSQTFFVRLEVTQIRAESAYDLPHLLKVYNATSDLLQQGRRHRLNVNSLWEPVAKEHATHAQTEGGPSNFRGVLDPLADSKYAARNADSGCVPGLAQTETFPSNFPARVFFGSSSDLADSKRNADHRDPKFVDVPSSIQQRPSKPIENPRPGFDHYPSSWTSSQTLVVKNTFIDVVSNEDCCVPTRARTVGLPQKFQAGEEENSFSSVFEQPEAVERDSSGSISALGPGFKRVQTEHVPRDLDIDNFGIPNHPLTLQQQNRGVIDFGTTLRGCSTSERTGLYFDPSVPPEISQSKPCQDLPENPPPGFPHYPSSWTSSQTLVVKNTFFDVVSNEDCCVPTRAHTVGLPQKFQAGEGGNSLSSVFEQPEAVERDSSGSISADLGFERVQPEFVPRDLVIHNLGFPDPPLTLQPQNRGVFDFGMTSRECSTSERTGSCFNPSLPSEIGQPKPCQDLSGGSACSSDTSARGFPAVPGLAHDPSAANTLQGSRLVVKNTFFDLESNEDGCTPFRFSTVPWGEPQRIQGANVASVPAGPAGEFVSDASPMFQ